MGQSSTEDNKNLENTKYFKRFRILASSLPCSQQPATEPYPQPDETSPHPYT
jgi:hypothetical protein